MAISTKIDRMTASIDRAGDSIARLNNEIDRAANTEFTEAPHILAPAGFTPPLPPSPPGTPRNPLPRDPFAPNPPPLPPNSILGPDGRPVRRISTGGGSSTSSQFKLADNPLIPSMTPGAPLMYKSDLEGFVAAGVCHLMSLPSGAEVISCQWGLYPGLSGGILSTSSGRSSGGSEGAPGRARASSDIVGLADDVFSSGASRGGRRGGGGTAGGGGTGSATGASTTSAPLAVDIDSRPITDRLDGLRSDIRQLSRSLAGDGGAGIRFKGGL